jgi:hypothetical protein
MGRRRGRGEHCLQAAHAVVAGRRDFLELLQVVLGLFDGTDRVREKTEVEARVEVAR